MEIIVLYKSKGGFAKKYAQWIAQELEADLYDASNISVDHLKAYDRVVFGGGLYAVGINGVKIITNNMGVLKGKKIAVFATGASPGREEVIQEVKDNNFTPEQQNDIGFFYLRGGFDYAKLGVIDKILMKLLKLKLSSKKDLTADETGMLMAYSNPVDFTRQDKIAPLVDYIRS